MSLDRFICRCLLRKPAEVRRVLRAVKTNDARQRDGLDRSYSKSSDRASPGEALAFVLMDKLHASPFALLAMVGAVALYITIPLYLLLS